MKKKLVSCILVVCMLLTMLPTMAWAEEVATGSNLDEPVVASGTDLDQPAASGTDLPAGTLDISKGSILITDTGYTQGIHKYTAGSGFSIVDDEGNPVTETAYTGGITIEGTSIENHDDVRRVIILEGTTNKTITLNGVTIDNGGDTDKTYMPAFVLMQGTADLVLVGNNNLTGADQAPAVQINKDATLTIKGTGSLIATGRNHTAGIGAPRQNSFAIDPESKKTNNEYRNGGNLIIESGTINAFGAGAGAGIGASHSMQFGDITINGGIVTVNSLEKNSDAGINTSTNSSGGGDITINGGKVSVTIKGRNYAAIGGGNSDSNVCSGDVTIAGGEISVDVTKNGSAYAIRTGGNFEMTGGTLVKLLKFANSTNPYITANTVSITGGNINDGYTGEITGRKLTKLVFTEEYAGKEVLVSETNDFTTPAKYWSAKVSADGTITTYLDAEAEKVYFKLNGDTTASEATISYGVANMGTQCTCGAAGTIEWKGTLEEELTLYKDMASSKNRGISASYKKVETCAAIVHPGYDDVKVTMTVKDAAGAEITSGVDAYATYKNGKLMLNKPAGVEKYTVTLTAASTAGTPVTKSVTVTIEDTHAGEFQWTNQLGDVTMFDGVSEIVTPISAKYAVAETVAEGYKTVKYSVTVKNKDGTEITSDKDSYATYVDGTLTLKRQNEVYSVELKAETENGEVSETQIAKVTSSDDTGFDMANGSITVTAGTDENAGKVVFAQGDKTLAVAAADKVTISGTSSTNNIEVSTDATIVLKDLSLTDIKAKSPIKLTNNATLNLWLEGENTLTTGTYNHAKDQDGTLLNGVTTAAIFVESGSTLVIDSEAGTLKNNDIDAAHYGDKQTGYKGSLFAKIGASRGGASAIGGDLFASPDMACGNITIKGGNVTAQATMASNKHLSGSAIGSGYAAGDGSVVAIKQCGDVTISGGNVRALVADGANTPGRAISSGVGDLTITGGVIYASAPNDGWNGDSAGSIATFTGTLTIGETNGDDSDLYIYAETTTADSDSDATKADVAAPAISVGGGTLNILSGTITAESTGDGPAIGVAPYTPVADEPIVLNIAGGTIDLVLVDETQAGTAAAMGIGGCNYDNAVEINISGGTIESNNLNIGVRGNAESTVNISGDAVVKIGNGNIVGDVTVGEGATLSTDEDKEIKGDVTVEGGATINGTTLPEDAGTITVSGDKVNEVAVTDGTVTLPAGSTITKDDGSSVELSNGGTIAADGAITAGGTVTTKDSEGNVVSTVVVPENKTATVDADGKVTAPAGTKVTVGDKETTLTNGGTVSADGTVKKNYVGGGYYTPPVSADVDSSSLNNAALAVGSAIKDGSAELEPATGYTKEEIAKLQKEGKLNLAIEKKSGYASVADKNAIDAAIAKAGGAVAGTSVLYFDITPVLKTDDGKVVATVTDTEKPLTITLDLSADLQKAAKDGKHIAVVRCHDGKATFIDGKLNAAKTKITFSSADFSTYAVVALDKQTSAQTFDAGIVVYGAMAVLAATGSAVVIGKKRRAE